MSGKRSRKGDGTVYEFNQKNKNGKIITRWVAKYTPPNRTKPIVKYGKTETEANRLLKQIKHDAIKNDAAQVQKPQSRPIWTIGFIM